MVMPYNLQFLTIYLDKSSENTDLPNKGKEQWDSYIA